MGKKYVTFNVNLEGLDDKARWYTIVTQYNYEQMVTNNLNKLAQSNENIDHAFCAIKEEEYVTTNAKGQHVVKTKNVKMMANYVFVKAKMDVDVWTTIMNITGVSAILCTAGIPVFTSEKKINEIKKDLNLDII